MGRTRIVTGQRHPVHQAAAPLGHPFGSDQFGAYAERFARFLGTPRYLIAQTVIVLVWIGVNSAALAFRWDAYPFILLNLAFSTQAAYAAPMILLAQTRQADRDKAHADAAAAHAEQLTAQLATLLEQNTTLTREVHQIVSGKAT